ncbi:hypothetical protein FOA52_007738 [Chlamydomonas sp. UWO 241]|nr:hypothetical protein FOA52_007738 [Chlamydomonas sp. UWO 241]
MSGNQDSGSVAPQEQPQKDCLCSNGCGFFANVGTHGMCSKCFRETASADQKLEAVAQKTVAALSIAVVAPPAAAAASTSSCEAAAAASSDAPPPPCNPSRCTVVGCKKKLGLTGFKCRCGFHFCGSHRYAEAHDCKFDYKTFERMKIADANPLVQAAKIQKL